MSSNSPESFLYSLFHRGIKIWSTQGVIKVFVPEDTELATVEKDYIKTYKNILIDVLETNQLISKESNIFILKAVENNQILSFQQERLWFLETYEVGSNAYNIPRVFKLKKSSDKPILENAIRALVHRHEILRTFIKVDDNHHACQFIDNNSEQLSSYYYSLCSHEELNQTLSEEINYVFNLQDEYPIRLCFYEFLDKTDNTQTTYVSIVIHHIAADGWSIDLFFKELRSFYFSQALNVNNPPSIQYKDYALWQRNYYSNDIIQKQVDYWKNTLSNFDTLLLPIDKQRPDFVDYEGENAYFELSQTTSAGLRIFAKNINVSLFSVLLGAFYLFLKSICNQNDILVGSVIANRPYEEVENLIGFFANTVVLRNKISDFESIGEYINQIARSLGESQAYQDFPFEKLLEQLNISQDASRHPLFQVMFVLQSFSAENSLSDMFEVYEHEHYHKIAKFDLTTMWDDSGDVLKGKFNYRTSLFYHSTISTFIEIYKDILMKISQVSKDKYYSISINNLVVNNEAGYKEPFEISDYPREATLFELFEKKAVTISHQIAVIDADLNLQYSYKQLSDDTLILSSFLTKIISKDRQQLVAILSEKGYNHVLTSLAIMKSGNAYLPLYHEWPTQRIDEVLAEGVVNIVLISKKLYQRRELVPLVKKYKCYVIEDLLDSLFKEYSLQNTIKIELPKVNSQDIAYVIFTSGSTGRPKGVTITHCGAVNTIYAINQKFVINEQDSILALSELSFDLSVYDMFGLLAAGGTIIYPSSDQTKDPSYWIKLIKQYNITLWNTVPQLASLLMSEVDKEQFDTKTLRLFLLSGDWVPLKLPEKIKSIFNNSQIISLGGATEGSIWSIWFEIIKTKDEWSSIPYGVAMPNQRMFILDDNLNRCPLNRVGEIFIGGDGLALNYWRNEEKTANSFIHHPLLGRIYRTGDLGKWHPEHYIEFIGRKDTQVKINGYRVEIDEISSCLTKINGVEDAVVLLKQIDNRKTLLAYYTGSKQVENSLSILMQERLPEYMVPSSFTHLDTMPLTSNGKLNREALLEINSLQTQRLIPPRNSAEKKLCQLFAEVLGLNSSTISITDDFFKLGGDSIASIQLMSRIKRNFNINITVKAIFTYKTIERLYDQIVNSSEISKQNFISAEQGLLNGDLELLPIQKWFFTRRFKNPHHWNQSFLIKVPRLDIEILKLSLAHLVAYHDSFRIRYKPIRDEHKQITAYSQFYVDIAPFNLQLLDLSTTKSELHEWFSQWQSNFNIVEGPLFSFGYIYNYPDQSGRIYVALHHLIIDTVSWRIIADDLKSIYEYIIHHINEILPDEITKLNILGSKGTSYRQWVNAVHRYANDHKSEENYWQTVLNDYSKHKNNITSLITSKQLIDRATYQLCSEKTRQLTTIALNPFSLQINDILLTALAYTLSTLTNKSIHFITLEGHGREEIEPQMDSSRTVGWFTTLFPVRLEINTDLAFSANIKIVKENLRAIPTKGLSYGSLIGYDEIELPALTFNYLGQFDSENELSWTISNEHSGITRAHNNEQQIISINAFIFNGIFQLDVASQLEKINLDKFIKAYQFYLEEILAYLVNKSDREYLMCDYPSYDSHITINNMIQNPIAINLENKRNETLLMFPTGIGGYECYLNNLAETLKLNLILFNNFNDFLKSELDEASLQTINFQNLAEAYIAKIKSIQPTGPYALFGWSFGGILAFEIARQLSTADREVSHLIMVDPLFNIIEAFQKHDMQQSDVNLVGQLNYKYFPENVLFKNDMKITLIKATMSGAHSDKIFDHYALETKYNYLDRFIDPKRINLVEIKSDHFSWVQNKSIINLITEAITKSLINDRSRFPAEISTMEAL